MKRALKQRLGITAAGLLAFLGVSAEADTFGSGANAFTIDFVDVGNAGNPDDAGAGSGLYFSPHGRVAYAFRMGTYEISENVITEATASGMTNVTAGAHTGAEPAGFMSWNEAAAFVNFLNTSTGHQAAYNLTFSGIWGMTLWSSEDAWQLGGENLFRHKDAYYFLPSEDEWYKAAYHKNDGVSANYWDYATGSNTAPVGVSSGTESETAVYRDPYGNPIPPDPANVDEAGGLSPYGTMGQNGNVFEMNESAFDGSNDTSFDNRGFRGGFWSDVEGVLRSSERFEIQPGGEPGSPIGFRVASVPEPAAGLLIFWSGLIWLHHRRAGRETRHEVAHRGALRMPRTTL